MKLIKSLLITLAFVSFVYAGDINELFLKGNVYEEEVYIINNNTVKGLSHPIIINKREVKNLRMLECLIANESGGDVLAQGDWRTSTNKFMAAGWLQFWEQTFRQYCVEKYNVAIMAEYKDPIAQLKCADIMLENNEGSHWTNYEKCR